jgi:hypothetical protein
MSESSHSNEIDCLLDDLIFITGKIVEKRALDTGSDLNAILNAITLIKNNKDILDKDGCLFL